MAALVERPRSDGSMAYQVRWRQYGTWQSETFGAKRLAQRFVLDVEDAGNQWPAGWTPGIGYEPGPPPPSATPFTEFADLYLQTRTGVSSYVLMRYRKMVAQLAPHFPTIEDLDDQVVVRWVRSMQSAGASPKTIANYHGLLYSILGYAVGKGLLSQNPCASTQLPRRSIHNSDGEPIACFLEPEEFLLIAEAMCASTAYKWRSGGHAGRRPKAHIPTCGIAYREDRDLITLAVHTGLRWGEIAGLRVGDIDVERRLLSVKRALKRDGDLRWVVGPPKTSRSRRVITLAPSLAAMIAAHLVGRAPDEFVFRTLVGGPKRQANYYRDRWQRAVALARERGLTKSPRFHDLRHTHVAWLIAANTPLPKIQQRLGHESIQTTIDVYGGLLRRSDDQLDAAVEAMLASVHPAQESRTRPDLRLVTGSRRTSQANART
jgi:integrase